MDLIDRSITDLAADIRSGALTAEALARAAIERVMAREAVVHAWQHFDEGAVIAQARALDRQSERGPLHGIPLAVKDIMDTADMPTGYGSSLYEGHRPPADASCVALLRAAGAVVMGKTVSTEFAYFRPGATANPHNPEHTPGGSSSGSAAAVADRMVPLGLGTQTAGSVTRPASYCGLVGFKSGHGSLSLAGIKPLAHSLDSLGWFTRSVDDAALVFSVMTGAAPVTDAALPMPPRIGVCRTFEWDHAEPATVQALESAAAELGRAGAVVEEVALPPHFADLVAAQQTVMAYEAARALVDERRRHKERLSPQIVALLETGWETAFADYRDALMLAARCRSALARLLAEWPVLLAPSAPGEAPRGLEATGDPIFNRMWTLLHVPSISLPVAEGPNGLPVGLQLIGPLAQESPLFAAARWTETILCPVRHA